MPSCSKNKAKEKDFTRVKNDLIKYGARTCGGVQPVMLLIMLTMYDHDKLGKPVYPSQKRLARQMKLSPKQVSRHMKVLVEMGFVSTTVRRKDDHRRNYYVVNYAALKEALIRTRTGIEPAGNTYDDEDAEAA